MTELPVFLIVFLSLIVLMLWFAFRHLVPRRTAKKDASLPVDLLLPSSYLKNSSEIETFLSELDEKRRNRKLSGGFRQHLTPARRLLLKELLLGLEEDFSRLDRLMCTVASLAPEIERKEETERLWLWIRFRWHYGLARFSLMLGRFSQPEVTSICQLFDRLATRTQEALEALEHSSLIPLRSKLGT